MGQHTKAMGAKAASHRSICQMVPDAFMYDIMPHRASGPRIRAMQSLGGPYAHLM